MPTYASSRQAKPVALLTAMVVALVSCLLALVGTAHATCTGGINCTYSDPWGTQEVAGSGWLSGGGVPIYSNGPDAPGGPSPDHYNCFTITGGAGGDSCPAGTVPTGIEWQCVELVNRLYLTKGWITSTWSGYGYQLYGNAPSSLTKEAQGSITHIGPGDVVAMSGGWGGLGHVAVVSSVNGNSFTIASQNTNGVYDTSFGLSNGSITYAGWGTYTVQGVVHVPNTTQTLVARVGNTVYAKQKLTDQWTTETTGATDVQAAGNRIAMLDSSGTLWAKDGIGGTWEQEISSVSQYMVTSGLLVARVGTTLYAKQNLTDQWTTETSSATDVEASGSRIAFRDGSGNVWAKDGVNGTMYEETGSVDQYVVSPTLLVIRVGGTVSAKQNLTDQWTTETTGATEVKADGTRIGYLDGSGALWVKDGIGGTWEKETTSLTDFDVTPELLLDLVGNTVYAKQNLTDQWTTETSSANAIQAAGNRYGFLDSSGTLWAMDGVSGTLYQEIGSVSQYAITTTDTTEQ